MNHLHNYFFSKAIKILEYAHIFSETNLVDAYQQCVKYIAVRIRSIKEIRDYLTKKKYDSLDIDEVIDRLLKNKLLDDDYFVECFIKDKLNFTSMGEYKIIAELKRHHISSSMIDKYSYLLDDDIMLSRIEKYVDKYIAHNNKLDSYKLRNKIYLYLINQGYSSDLVVRVLNQRF